MLKGIFEKIARFLAPEVFNTLEERALFTEMKINKRVADIVASLDPMELVLKEYNGSFLKEYERPDETLNEGGKIQMEMWGYQQHTDPCLEKLLEWLANSQANTCIRKASTNEQWFMGKAMLLCIKIIQREIQRLHNLYEIRIRPIDEIENPSNTVED